METKCSKYQTLFIFKSEEELKSHIETCPDCKKEQEEMDKVSGLLKEVRFEVLKRKTKKKAAIKIACAFLTVFLASSALFLVGYNINSDNNFYGEVLSAYDYGFPVDSYGLITVE